jgi:hypothetical protein
MNDINNFNDIDKLRNLDPKDFLTDDEKNQMSEIFNSVGMDDWMYDSSDNSMRLKIKIIQNQNTKKKVIVVSILWLIYWKMRKLSLNH